MTAVLAKDYEELNQDVRDVVDNVRTFLKEKKETKRFNYYHYVVVLEDVGNTMKDEPFPIGNGMIDTTEFMFCDSEDSWVFSESYNAVAFQYLLANYAELERGRVADYLTGCFSNAKERIEDNNKEEETCYSFCVGNSGVNLMSIVVRFKMDGTIGRKDSEYGYLLDPETNTVSIYKIPQQYWYN
jgi:hypothetical protein